MLRCQRERFSLPDGERYLNCAYMSPLLRSVEAAGIEGIRRKRFPAAIGAAAFFDEADRLRGLFARLIGVPDSTRVAILPAVSYGISIAARNLPLERGQTVVLLEGQFPSHVLAWRRAAAARGAEVRVVPAPTAIEGRSRAWNAAIMAAIDDRTATVALPPIHWTDGTRIDLAAAAGRARDHGAAVVIDGTQSVGAAPFDFDTVRPDALVCATYKWLMGPYSLALGWFGPMLDHGEPLEEAWLARTDSQDFRRLVAPSDEYRPDAARYDVGGRSNFILLPMAIAALEQLLEWDVANVEAYCRAITDGFFDRVGQAGYAADAPDGRAAHLFGLRLPPGMDAEGLRATLERRRIHVSLRGDAVRVSPHLYNDAGDLAALADSLLEAAAGVDRPAGPGHI